MQYGLQIQIRLFWMQQVFLNVNASFPTPGPPLISQLRGILFRIDVELPPANVIRRSTGRRWRWQLV